MAQWSWQQPPNPGQATSPNRPRCFGFDSAFDVTSRECRGCEYQSSCRDTIYRARNSQASPPQRGPTPQPAGPNYYDPRYSPPPSPIGVVAQNFQPQQVSYPVAVPRQQAIQPTPQPQQIQQQPLQQMLQQERYGWLNDPLYYMGQASPPPQRPQLQNEHFFERVVKNVGLSMLESMFFQGFLAVRQMVLPPAPPSPAPGERDIDITPQ